MSDKVKEFIGVLGVLSALSDQDIDRRVVDNFEDALLRTQH